MASGDRLALLYPLATELPASNRAWPYAINAHPVLRFLNGVLRSTVWTFVLPSYYSGGGVTVYIHWSSTATTGDVDWDGEFERMTAQDIDSDGFAAAQSSDNNSPPGNPGDIAVDTITFTNGAQMDSLAAGELGRFRLTRDGVSDTMTTYANVLMVELKET